MYRADPREQSGFDRRPFPTEDSGGNRFSDYGGRARGEYTPSQQGRVPPTIENLLDREGGAAYAEDAAAAAATPSGKSAASPTFMNQWDSPVAQQGGRRHVPTPGGAGHMLDLGVSAPPAERRGRGRRHAHEEDHQVTRGDYQPEDPPHAHGRRNFNVQDHVKSGIFQPSGEVRAEKAMTSEEVKALIRELITSVHGMFVFDERKWSEVAVQSHGSYWKLQALNEQCRSLGREGPTPKAIAEKLAMSPVADLRHFGVRFAGRGEARPETSHRVKGSPCEDNPTLASPGMQGVLGTDGGYRAQAQGSAGLSNSRRDPDQMTRRYIASGKDHFESAEVASHGNRGQAADMSFANGLERGIGHGKRHIDRRDHLLGSTLNSGRGT